MGNELPELRPFIRMHGDKCQTKNISFDPANLRLVYPPPPTQPQRVNPAFKCRIGHHRMIGFNAASAVREVQGFPLRFALPSGEGTAKLGSKAWVHSLFYSAILFQCLSFHCHRYSPPPLWYRAQMTHPDALTKR